MKKNINSNISPLGHRERVKTKFLNNYNKNYKISEQDILEMLLFFSIPRKDVKPLAKELLHQFRDFNTIVNASDEELKTIPHITNNTCLLFKIVKLSHKELMYKKIVNQPVLNNSANIEDYIYSELGHEKIEYIKIFYLNSKYELIKDEIIQEGTINYTSLYPREIVKRALNIGATSYILAHNHPSGYFNPSEEDIKSTLELYAATKPLNLILHDHYIVSKKGITSLRKLGYL